MRLKLIPSETKIDFFSKIRLWLGISAVMVIVALGSVGTLGLNYGIDFLEGQQSRRKASIR